MCAFLTFAIIKVLWHLLRDWGNDPDACRVRQAAYGQIVRAVKQYGEPMTTTQMQEHEQEHGQEHGRTTDSKSKGRSMGMVRVLVPGAVRNL